MRKRKENKEQDNIRGWGVEDPFDEDFNFQKYFENTSILALPSAAINSSEPILIAQKHNEKITSHLQYKKKVHFKHLSSPQQIIEKNTEENVNICNQNNVICKYNAEQKEENASETIEITRKTNEKNQFIEEIQEKDETMKEETMFEKSKKLKESTSCRFTQKYQLHFYPVESNVKINQSHFKFSRSKAIKLSYQNVCKKKSNESVKCLSQEVNELFFKKKEAKDVFHLKVKKTKSIQNLPEIVSSKIEKIEQTEKKTNKVKIEKVYSQKKNVYTNINQEFNDNLLFEENFHLFTENKNKLCTIFKIRK